MMRNAMIIFTNRNELIDEDDPADQNVDAWIGEGNQDYISKENTLHVHIHFMYIYLD
jgi:hypothetical protein